MLCLHIIDWIPHRSFLNVHLSILSLSRSLINLIYIDVLHPDSGADAVLSHVNPWNFTARMMIVHPYQLVKLLSTPYDVVHIVMPANLSGMWILALYKILRCVKVRRQRGGNAIVVVTWCSYAISFSHPCRFKSCIETHHIIVFILLLSFTARVKASSCG